MIVSQLENVFSTAGASRIVHATCVAVAGNAVLIIGPSGAGKSALALQLMALGAVLVADDRCELQLAGGAIYVHRPKDLPAMIEARGIGLLKAELAPSGPLRLIVDMGQEETARLPKERTTLILDQNVKTFHKYDAPHFPAAIFHYLASCNDG